MDVMMVEICKTISRASVMLNWWLLDGYFVVYDGLNDGE